MALINPTGSQLHDLMDTLAKHVAIAGNNPNHFLPIMHRGMGKTSYIQFDTPCGVEPRVKVKGNRLRGSTITRYGSPQITILDDLFLDPSIHTIVIDSLSMLDARDILIRDTMEDDCTWKQGQVAKWCNKQPRRWKK